MQRSLSIILFCSAVAIPCLARDIRWVHLTSKDGQLPAPGTSTQQTGLLVAKIDKHSPATDFVVSCRQVAPGLIWYRHTAKGWERYVIEKEFLKIEAGGAAFDIDGDGDLDIVFGDDSQGNRLYWWENPYPDFDPNVSWKRHLIKDGGANQHHDQIFADFKGTGKPQLAFWNQKAKTLFLADIPADPRRTEPWPLQTVFSGQAGEDVKNAAKYAEGIDAFDVDGDGRLDLLAGNYWFKYEGGNKFRPVQVSDIGGRIRAGKFKPGKYAQIIIGPGDGTGPLMFCEAKGDPTRAVSWTCRNLLGRDVIHGHTLDLGDIDGDGNLDIFAAEMAKWSANPGPDNPGATAWILYGDGKGNFRTTVLANGEGWHEGKLADVDGDGDLDIINKPYTWETPRIDLWLNDGTGKRADRSATPVPFQHEVGMELWTYRQELTRELPGTLALIRKLGFADVETASYYGRTPDEFRRILDAAGLTCSSIIAGYDKLASNLDGVIAEARALGAHYVLTAGFPHQSRPTVDEVKHAAVDFNQWGGKLKAAGLQFGYHPHGFEFVPYGQGSLFDLLLAETKLGRVVYEMDVFWFAHGGANPLEYLQKYPERFALVHLKDMAKGTPMGVNAGRAPNEASVPLGAGQLDLSAILQAAVKAGVKRYYIEDESPAAARQVPESVQFLKSVRF